MKRFNFSPVICKHCQLPTERDYVDMPFSGRFYLSHEFCRGCWRTTLDNPDDFVDGCTLLSKAQVEARRKEIVEAFKQKGREALERFNKQFE